MKKTLKKILAIALIAASLNVVAENKNFEQLSVKAVADNLSVEMKTTKDSFKPNEAIKFNIKGNQDFFLYIFAVDQNSGNVTMMLPNAIQKGNKYSGKQMHRVPNANEIELISDRSGTEKIVMLASSKYLTWDTKGYTEAGKYMNTSNENFNSQLETLSIRPVKNDLKSANKDMIVREILVTIQADKPTGSALTLQLSDQQNDPAQKVEAPLSDTPIVLLSLNKAKYSAGDDAYMAFAADRPGFIHLIIIDAKKRYTELAVQKVNGNQVYRLKAVTAKPKGKHQLIAAWTKEGKLNKNDIPELTKSKGKSLEAFRIVDKNSMVYKVVDFKIK